MTFLFPVQRIIGRIQVQDDFFRRFLVCLEEDVNQQAVHRSVIQHDLLVAFLLTGRLPSQFQSVQGALSRQSRLPEIWLVDQHSQQGIVPQLLVIVQIFVSQGQTIDSLCHQFLHRMIDQIRIPIIGEASSELAENPHPLLDLPQKQTSAITGDRSAVELRPDLATFLGSEIRSQPGYTLWS